MSMETITNIADIVSYQADIQADAIAVYTKEENLTYKQLDNLIWKLSNYLHKKNVVSGDVVTLVLNNELTILVSMLALARLGATVFSIPTSTPKLVFENMLANVNSKLMITDNVNKLKNSIPSLTIDLNHIEKSITSIDKSISCTSPNAPWSFIAGSGSTGKKKIMPISHLQQIYRTKTSPIWLNATNKDRIATFVHINFSISKSIYLNAFYIGASIVLFDKQELNLFNIYKKYEISILHATVFHIEKILKESTEKLTSKMPLLKVLYVGGSIVSDYLRKEIVNKITKNLCVRYGTNETGTISYMNFNEFSAVGSIGKGLFDKQIEIVDQNNNIVTSNTIGEIRVKNEGLINGYLHDEKATKKAFKDGWFYPGDLGKFSDDGQLIYMGRSDHMMIMDAINIYPAEIERALTGYADIIDAAAMPLSSKVHQNIPVCAVVLQKHSMLNEKMLMDYAFKNLGSSAPRKVFILNEIPRNNLGKLMRDDLKKHIKDKLKKEMKKVPQDKNENSFTLMIEKNKIPYDIKLLDRWFHEILKIDIRSDFSQQSIIDKTLCYILLLTSTLLQAINIPSFNPGKIIDNTFNPSSQKYKVRIEIDLVDYFSKKIFKTVLSESKNIILKYLSKPRTYKNTQELFQNINIKILKPFKKVSYSRKSTVPVLREAYELNIPIMHLGSGVYQLGWGSKARYMDGSTSQFDSAMGAKLSQNKIITSNLIRAAGLPAPKNELVKSKIEALNSAKNLAWPVVIKPIDRDRGEGITTDVNSKESLYKAFNVAKRFSKSKRVIVESQVSGVCHRIFIANSQLLYAVKRLPKSVKGDGKRSITELIYKENLNEKNSPPWLKTEPFPMDNMAIEAIHHAGFSIYDVLAKGVLVPLRDIESTRWGGYDKSVTDSIHPENIEIAIRAANLFKLGVAGIDIITPDITQPWYSNGAIINEVNFSPLFGLADISRAAIPQFLEDYIYDDGRITVKAFVGDETAMNEAKKYQKEKFSKNIKCFIASEEKCFHFMGNEMRLNFNTLSKKVKALLMNSMVDELVLVIQSTEELNSSLDIKKFDEVLYF